MIKSLSKVILAGSLLVGSVLPSFAQNGVVTGQILDTATFRNTIILTTNRASVYSLIVSATANALVNFYDIDVTNGPYWGTNFVAASYVSRVSYYSNGVSSFVGNNGYTNWYTNQGVFTFNVTNAASTNALSPLLSVAVGANTAVTVSADALFVRGIVAVAQAGTNINMIVNYRSGR